MHNWVSDEGSQNVADVIEVWAPFPSQYQLSSNSIPPLSNTEALGSNYSIETIGPIVQELYTNYSSAAMYEIYPDAIEFLEIVQKSRSAGALQVAALTNFDRRDAIQ